MQRDLKDESDEGSERSEDSEASPRRHACETPVAPAPQDEQTAAKQFRREKRDVHGWVVLDKPVGMTSTHAVAR